MNKQITIYFSPHEYSQVSGIPLPEVFEQIRKGMLSVHFSDDGIKIVQTYTENQEVTTI